MTARPLKWADVWEHAFFFAFRAITLYPFALIPRPVWVILEFSFTVPNPAATGAIQSAQLLGW